MKYTGEINFKYPIKRSLNPYLYSKYYITNKSVWYPYVKYIFIYDIHYISLHINVSFIYYIFFVKPFWGVQSHFYSQSFNSEVLPKVFIYHWIMNIKYCLSKNTI